MAYHSSGVGSDSLATGGPTFSNLFYCPKTWTHSWVSFNQTVVRKNFVELLTIVKIEIKINSEHMFG